MLSLLSYIEAKQMPLTTSNLHRLVKSKHQYIDRNLGSVVSIIRHSIQNAPAYEAIAEQLREERMETVSLTYKLGLLTPHRFL